MFVIDMFRRIIWRKLGEYQKQGIIFKYRNNI